MSGLVMLRRVRRGDTPNGACLTTRIRLEPDFEIGSTETVGRAACAAESDLR
jgi:hypothetical protein